MRVARDYKGLVHYFHDQVVGDTETPEPLVKPRTWLGCLRRMVVDKVDDVPVTCLECLVEGTDPGGKARLAFHKMLGAQDE